jgi:hypothetical protein
LFLELRKDELKKYKNVRQILNFFDHFAYFIIGYDHDMQTLEPMLL